MKEILVKSTRATLHVTLLVYKLVSLDDVEKMHAEAETPFCPI